MLITPLFAKDLITLLIAPLMFLKALITALIAPLLFNPFHNSFATVTTFLIEDAIPLIIPSISISSRNFPTLSANAPKSSFSKASVIPTIAFIPNLLNFSKVGINLFAIDSLAPSIAWSTVLNCVAILEK